MIGCKLSVEIFPATKAPPQIVVVKKEVHRFLSYLISLKGLPNIKLLLYEFYKYLVIDDIDNN
ncbi:hypothetical protein C0971_10410 [Bacillus methanolicus]|nr:hypothetical protein C0971_10410 [Bacillus methanolicus]